MFKGEKTMSEAEINKIISDNLNRLMEIRGTTQSELAEYMGVSQATISNWCKGVKMPRMDKIDKLCDFFHIIRSDLMQEYKDPTDGVTNLIYPSAYRIPIVGRICAGDGCFVIEEKMGYFTIDHTIKADFALVVKGDSMIDIDINDGDIVLIKKVYDYYDGKIYAIRLIDENEATIKRCYFEEDKVIMQPCNPEFKPMIADGRNVSVVGECVGVYHAL